MRRRRLRAALGLGLGLALGLAGGLGSLAGAARAADYAVHYRARILPDLGLAEVEIEVEQSEPVLRALEFDFDDPRWFELEADAGLSRGAASGDPAASAASDESGASGGPDARVTWEPPAGGGRLRYRVRIDRLREPAEYDARCTPRWLLARAEHLFVPMAARFRSGAESEASLRLVVPPGWTTLTPYPPAPGAGAAAAGRFAVEAPHRSFDPPRGWLLAGELDRVEAQIEGARVVVAAPREHGARIQDLLALLRWTLPPLRRALGSLPPRLLVVVADDPMWRGGLSGPRSLYLHADRPLIETDGSSPLLHELIHVLTHARAMPAGDWIAEGLAELYSLEALRRSGTSSEEEHARALERLRAEGASVRSLAGEASGAKTARAVGILRELDDRLRRHGQGQRSLDDVLALLTRERTVLDPETFAELVERATGFDPRAFLSARVPGG